MTYRSVFTPGYCDVVIFCSFATLGKVRGSFACGVASPKMMSAIALPYCSPGRKATKMAAALPRQSVKI